MEKKSIEGYVPEDLYIKAPGLKSLAKVGKPSISKKLTLYQRFRRFFDILFGVI